MIVVITETEGKSIFHALNYKCHRIRLEDYLCQFSDSYLKAWSRNLRKTQPAKFDAPPIIKRLNFLIDKGFESI